MYALEVAKGPAAIRFGPYTIGGALNMISTPIPEQNKGKVKTRIGEDDFSEIHAYYGGTSGKLSYLLEVYDEQSKGFKQLPDGSDTGYDITSLLGKLRYSGENQYLEVKYEYTDEVSDETYYGLTDADFASNPYQRYAGTQADEMDNEHWQWVVTHHIDFNESVSLTSKVYETWFDRNWYKLSKVGGSSFGSVVDDASKLAILKGGDSSAGCLASPTHDNCGDTDLAVKANNRQYEARGVQFKFNVDIGNHAIEAGLRIHEDEMTRVQWEDDYYMFNGQAVGYRFGIPGASGEANNRFEKAEATSLYITDEIALGRLTITPGIRMEDIDGERFEGDAAATLQPRNTRTKSNSYDETMLALSALYDLSDTTLLVGGIY
jgi:Fe(3+) dicitrate transport protein